MQRFTHHPHLLAAALCGLCMLLSAMAYGYDINWSPFLPQNQPRPYPLQRCTLVKTFKNTERDIYVWVFQTPKVRTVSVVVTWSAHDDDPQTVSIVNRNTGRQLLSPTPLDGWVASGFIDVWTGLLNEDATPDFVVQANSGGCGLGGQRCYRMMMLSVGGTYRARGLWTYNADAHDFVDVNHDGRAEMIHTAFISPYPEVGKDGRHHNYWVFHLLRFTDGRFVPADRRLRGFPCWILYTFKHNHRPTGQLTDKQKTKAWKNGANDICPEAKDWPAI